ncbi:MAG: hypothetical protein P1Q69_14020 [Candidatus Thorarchaeota archaeon]|nr:hypothetical protein [Candidatus Thorarchaeota archaeon]
MRNEEQLPLKKYRQVSELRTQFICEHRLLLQKKHGTTSSQWSRKGTKLHNIASNSDVRGNSDYRIIKAVLVIMIALAGILWILG